MKNLLFLFVFIASISTNLTGQTLISETTQTIELGETDDGVFTGLDVTVTSTYSNDPPGTGTYTNVTHTCAWGQNGVQMTAGSIPCSGGTCRLIINSEGLLCLSCVGSSDPGSNALSCKAQIQ